MALEHGRACSITENQNELGDGMSRVIALAKSGDLKLTIEVVERLFFLALFVSFNFRILPKLADHFSLITAAVFLSETMVAFFLLTRRVSRDISLQPGDWLLAFGGTAGPLLIAPVAANPLLPEVVSLSLLGFGFSFQLWAKLTLRRSFGLVAANRGVKVSGPYAFLRHPMYAGYLATHVAFFSAFPTAWNAAVYGICLIVQCFRLLAEERVLGQDPAYRSFMKTTRYRLIPFVF